MNPNILVNTADELSQVSLPAGRVSAGYPAEAYNWLEDRLDLNKYIIRNKPHNCCLWATHSGLTGEGILLDDLIVVDSSRKPHKDSVCLFWLDDEYSLRRIERHDEGTELIPLNPDLATVTVEGPVDPVGIVTHVVKKYANYHHNYGGYPVDAANYIEKGMDYHRYLIDTEETVFPMWVDGDSMSGDGIDDGDLVLVDKYADAFNNSILVFDVPGGFTTKRLELTNGGARLVPSNPDFPVLTFSEDEEIKRWGVVVGVIKKFI